MTWRAILVSARSYKAARAVEAVEVVVVHLQSGDLRVPRGTAGMPQPRERDANVVTDAFLPDADADAVAHLVVALDPATRGVGAAAAVVGPGRCHTLPRGIDPNPRHAY
jgi:hypothetical protein